MNKTTIIIPSRLNAQRFPNKPLKLINNKEMILHVYDAAVKSNAGGGHFIFRLGKTSQRVIHDNARPSLVADRLYGVAALAASTPTVRSSGALR